MKSEMSVGEDFVSREEFSSSTINLTLEAHTLQEESESLCGLWSWTPKWMQKFATPKVYVTLYSLCAMVQGAQYTYFSGCMTTMERRFSYDSKTSGVIQIFDEIGPILLCLVIGYFGNFCHRPRLMSIGMFIGSLSCFIMAIPYFMYGSKSHRNWLSGSKSSLANSSDISTEMCSTKGGYELTCSEHSTFASGLPFFFLGYFVKGTTGLIFYVIGTSYLDDNVKKKDSPLYLGTLYALRLLGPVGGFLLSSFCLQYYEDPFYDPGFGQKDPRWIGAWWLGFVILGAAIFIFSIPMILFPRRFPSAKLPEELRKDNKKNEEEEKKVKETPIQQIKGMFKALLRLGKNPILICHYLGGVLRLNGLVGYYVLLPKYMEMQFRQSASKASLYSGPASIIGMQFGILFGGYAIRKYKPRPRKLTGCILFAETFSVTALVVCMFITCPMNQMTGTTMMDSQRLDLVNSCNANCSCTTKTYTPVCGPDGKSNYFSPCFAGCSGYNKTGNKEVFTNCTCVHDEFGDLTEGIADKGYCNSDCQLMLTFIVILTIGKFLSSTARVGNTIVTLRCVDPKDKSVALGTLSGVFSLLAFIPYPLIYGALTDASCIVWEKSCGKTGNCWVYDTDKFRYLLHGVSAAFIFCGCISDIFVCILSPRLKNLYDEEEEESEKPKLEKETVTNQDIQIINGGPLGVFSNGFDNGAMQSVIEAEENNTHM